MINKTRWLAGLTLGCVLSTPAAFAEEYKGFYFGVWGGAGSVDAPAKSDVDDFFDDMWVQDILTDIATSFNRDPEAEGTLSLTTASRGRSSLDDSTAVWGALVGYRFNKYVAGEIGYVNLGEVKYDFAGTIDSQFVPFDPQFVTENDVVDYNMGYRFTSAGPTAAVVGMLPLGQAFDLHAKAGIFLADTRQTVRLRNVDTRNNFHHRRADASQTEFFVGLGATWNVSEGLGLRVEYQKFLDVGDDEKTYEQDIDVINFAVLFK